MRPGTSGGSSSNGGAVPQTHNSAAASALRTNMSSFIRDTVYGLHPARAGASGAAGVGSDGGPQTLPLSSPRTANGAPPSGVGSGRHAGGSHSSKFAVLNSLATTTTTATPASSGNGGGGGGIDVLGNGAGRAGAGRGGLDLASLLAGVGGGASAASGAAPHTASSLPPTHPTTTTSATAGASASSNTTDAQQIPQPPPARRVPRTLSGRPRPPIGPAAGGGATGGSARSSRSNSNTTASGTPRGAQPGGLSSATGYQPLSAKAMTIGDMADELGSTSVREDGPLSGGGGVNRPREDAVAPPLAMNPIPQHQTGIHAPHTGNQTARGGRPASAATSTPLDPLGFGSPSSVSSAPAGEDRHGSGGPIAVPPAAPGTMPTLGGCAVGPEFRGMQPARVLALYENQLSKYERREVVDYDDVYFIGPDAAKTDAPVANAPNFGYDDDRGDYLVCKNDHIAYRYEVINELGRGSFGQVLRAKDYKRNCECALKIIRNRRRFHQQAQVEIRLLEHLRCRDPDDRSCTVRMLNYFQFRSHTCITFELHAMNLYELTKLNRYQPFPAALIKRFTGQLLVAVSFMWRESIVHCDLKPENILLKQENKTGIKVIDFGSSCFESERVYSYIQSRFYRAPEIMLGLPYGRPIDLWSVGCIICEMAIGFPIFPGENEHDQLLCIMEILGVPPARLVDKSPRKAKFFDSAGQPRIVPNSRNKVHRPSTKDLQSVLRTDDASFVDFILRFLRWDPADRITPNEAMRHPYIAECFHQETIPGGPATAGQALQQQQQAPSQSSSQSSPAAAAGSSSSMHARGNSAARPPASGGVHAPAAHSSESEPQPAAPLGSLHSSRQPSANTARGGGLVTGNSGALGSSGAHTARGVGGLSQFSSLTVTSAGSGPHSARGAAAAGAGGVGAAALPSIGTSGAGAASGGHRRRQQNSASGRMPFTGTSDMFM